MDAVLSPPQNGVRHGAQDGTGADTRLQGRTLLLARGLYVMLVILLLGLFAAGVVAQRRFLVSGNVGLHIDYNRAGEAVISSVSGISATEAGIQAGDILLAIDGQPIAPMSSRLNLVRRLGGPVGTQVALDVRTADGTTRRFMATRDAGGLAEMGMPVRRYALYGAVLDVILVPGFLIPALIIFARKSDDWLGIFVSAVLVLIGVANTGAFAALLWFDGTSNPEAFLVYMVSFLYKIATLLLLYVFPNGRFVPRWTRILVVVGAAWAVLYSWLWPYALTRIVDVSLYATGLYAQIYRYRRVSSAQERQQTKWLVFGIVVAFLGVYAQELPLSLYPTLQDPTTAAGIQYQLVGRLFSAVALLTLAATFSIAILRYRLYNIDLIIHRTLVYLPVTALVAGLFAGFVKLTEKLLLSGEQSLAAAALGALVMSAALTPIKVGTQKLVDKHFKEIPNPSKQLKEFAKQLRLRLFSVDREEITRRLLEEAVMGFEAESGAVYLASSGGMTLTHATRGWSGEAALSIPLQHAPDGEQLGVIVLGARREGAEYSTRDRSVLEEAARVVALAIEEDRKGPAPVTQKTSTTRGIRRRHKRQR